MGPDRGACRGGEDGAEPRDRDGVKPGRICRRDWAEPGETCRGDWAEPEGICRMDEDGVEPVADSREDEDGAGWRETRWDVLAGSDETSCRVNEDWPSLAGLEVWSAE